MSPVFNASMLVLYAVLWYAMLCYAMPYVHQRTGGKWAHGAGRGGGGYEGIKLERRTPPETADGDINPTSSSVDESRLENPCQEVSLLLT